MKKAALYQIIFLVIVIGLVMLVDCCSGFTLVTASDFAVGCLTSALVSLMVVLALNRSDKSEREFQYTVYLRRICVEVVLARKSKKNDWEKSIKGIIDNYKVYCAQYIKKSEQEAELIKKISSFLMNHDLNGLTLYINTTANVNIE